MKTLCRANFLVSSLRFFSSASPLPLIRAELSPNSSAALVSPAYPRLLAQLPSNGLSNDDSMAKKHKAAVVTERSASELAVQGTRGKILHAEPGGADAAVAVNGSLPPSSKQIKGRRSKRAIKSPLGFKVAEAKRYMHMKVTTTVVDTKSTTGETVEEETFKAVDSERVTSYPQSYVPPLRSSSRSSVRQKDPITAPSKASGGVPEPTKLYLSAAQGAPSRLAEPRRILVVVDLNGTLLFRPSKRRSFHFVPRPHARPFMQYLLSTFVVAVWSSARPENVYRMVESLLTRHQRSYLAVIWSRSDFGLSESDYELRVQCYKRLTLLWKCPAIIDAHPDNPHTGCWNQTNTVLIDDSAEKARSEPHNLLLIPTYSGPGSDQTMVLPQVHDYINELAHQADISRYIRQNPFTLQTPS